VQTGREGGQLRRILTELGYDTPTQLMAGICGHMGSRLTMQARFDED
jgi:hypothetical protein